MNTINNSDEKLQNDIGQEESIAGVDVESDSDADAQDSKANKDQIDYLEGWKRCQADFQNYKRDEAARSKDIIAYANSNLMLDILSALDIFDLADKHVPQDIKDNHKQWLDGFFYGVKELQKQLENNGLTRIEADNVEFNPIEHEIVGEASYEEGAKIIQVRAGYKLNGKLIRPAQVSLSN